MIDSHSDVCNTDDMSLQRSNWISFNAIKLVANATMNQSLLAETDVNQARTIETPAGLLGSFAICPDPFRIITIVI